MVVVINITWEKNLYAKFLRQSFLSFLWRKKFGVKFWRGVKGFPAPKWILYAKLLRKIYAKRTALRPF